MRCIDSSDKKFLEYCASEPIFEWFIHKYVSTDGQLSFTIGSDSYQRESSMLDILVRLIQPPIKLCIWEKDQAIASVNDIISAKIVYQCGPEDGIPHHVYHLHGESTHFELMSELPNLVNSGSRKRKNTEPEMEKTCHTSQNVAGIFNTPFLKRRRVSSHQSGCHPKTGGRFGK